MSGKKALRAALILVVALAGLALVIPFDAPGLGRDVEDRVRSATGIDLEISRSRFRLLQGLVLEDVTFAFGSFRGHFPRIVLDERREVQGIRLTEGRVDFESGAVSIEGLALTLSRLDSDPRAVTKLHGLSVEGDLSLRAITFVNWHVHDVAARISAENGRFELQDLRLATDGGEISGEALLDFNSLPFRYRASLLGPSFQVESVGRGKLRLEADGFGTKLRSLKGNGVFELERGPFPDAPWIREIDPALAGAEHGAAEIPFEVRGERVYLGRFEIEIGEKILELEGSLSLDGTRDLRPSVRRRRD